MQKLELNVYDDDDNIVKTAEAQLYEVRMGVVRRLMRLVKVDSMDDTAEILSALSNAWEEITVLLSKFFPDMTDKDWDNVKISELLQVIVAILGYTFKEMLKVPTEKNPKAE